MSVGINNAIANYLAGEQVNSKLLVVIKLSETEIYRFIADDDVESVDINGETYMATPITIGTREENSDNSLENLDITLSNKRQVWAAIAANRGNAFLGKTCTLYQWFPEYPDEPPVKMYTGILNEIKMTMNEFKATITRVLGDYEQQAPLMTFQVNCQYVFKGDKCKYSGTKYTTCGKTVDECMARGNILRFGGFPSVPEEFLINK